MSQFSRDICLIQIGILPDQNVSFAHDGGTPAAICSMKVNVKQCGIHDGGASSRTSEPVEGTYGSAICQKEKTG